MTLGDITRAETVEHIEHHLSTFLTINPKGIVVVALNKSDLMQESNAAGALPFKDPNS